MPIPFNESAISGRHTVSYRTLDAYHGNPSRDIEVLATRREIEALMRDGFLVRHNLLDVPTVELLRASLEEVLARETDIAQGDTAFGGVFLRHLADKHPMVLELLAFAPALGVARAAFGPVVVLRGLDARLCSPGQQHSEVEWHHHQRVIPQPLPPMWCRPQSLDALIYLDDIDENNRPLFVVPGSHQWLERELPAGQKDDRADQQQITFGAGSMVLMFGSLWDRARPTDGMRHRRLIISGYSPAWQKPAIYGRKPDDGLTHDLARNGDEETRELLGLAGYM